MQNLLDLFEPFEYYTIYHKHTEEQYECMDYTDTPHSDNHQIYGTTMGIHMALSLANLIKGYEYKENNFVWTEFKTRNLVTLMDEILMI